jgi:peptide subunit release factor 1 (eRF1)
VYSDGEIKVLFQERSFVDGKMRVGGQSAKRFAQNRDNAITLWFKKVDGLLMELKDKEIYLGISFVYKNRFIDTLHTYNKQKIKKVNKTEYTNITGIYQYINRLESKTCMTEDE